MKKKLANLLVTSTKWLDQIYIVHNNFHLQWNHDWCIWPFLLISQKFLTQSWHGIFEILCIHITYRPGWLLSYCRIAIYHRLFFWFLRLDFIPNKDFIYLRNCNLFIEKGSNFTKSFYKYHIPLVLKILHHSWIETGGIGGPEWHNEERIFLVVWYEWYQLFSIETSDWNLIIYLYCIQSDDPNFIWSVSNGAYIIIEIGSRKSKGLVMPLKIL